MKSLFLVTKDCVLNACIFRLSPSSVVVKQGEKQGSLGVTPMTGSVYSVSVNGLRWGAVGKGGAERRDPQLRIGRCHVAMVGLVQCVCLAVLCLWL